MRTRLLIHATNELISENLPLVKPMQETIEVEHRLLDGSYLIQTVGNPAKSWELEFVVSGTLREAVDTCAARKTLLRLERHGKSYVGYISGNVDWEQLVGSTDPAKSLQQGHILLRETGGD